MSTDLIAELRAALDAEEAAAQAATSGPWRADPYDAMSTQPSDWFVSAPAGTVGIFPIDYSGPSNAAHIARHDPAFVLADIAAKRGIIECHEPWTAANGDIICGRCGREHIDGRPGGHYPCQTMRLLAEAYGITTDG